MPAPDTPLYNHPLTDIEAWLRSQGCEQDRSHLHCWRVHQSTWQAEIFLEEDRLLVVYLGAGEGGQDLPRAFKYSLSRRDIQDAVFAGP